MLENESSTVKYGGERERERGREGEGERGKARQRIEYRGKRIRTPGLDPAVSDACPSDQQE